MAQLPAFDKPRLPTWEVISLLFELPKHASDPKDLGTQPCTFFSAVGESKHFPASAGIPPNGGMLTTLPHLTG